MDRQSNNPPATVAGIARRTTFPPALIALALTLLFFSACGGSGGQSYLLALDANNGEEVWRIKAPAARMGPAVVGEGLLSVQGTNDCRSGLTAWTFDARTGEASNAVQSGVVFHSYKPCGGYPPVLENSSTTFDRILGPASEGGGDLVATDRSTGRQKWILRFPDSEKSGLYITVGEHVLVYVFYTWDFSNKQDVTKTVVSVDADTGEELWRHEETTLFGSIQPLEELDASLGGDNVYLVYRGGSGDRPDQRSGRLAVRDARTGALRWQYDSDIFTPHTGLAFDGQRVVIARGDRVLALNESDGTHVWEKQLSGSPMTTAEVTLAGEVAYLAVMGSPSSGIGRTGGD
jgi:outer membrane protein assembly factor BamB